MTEDEWVTTGEITLMFDYLEGKLYHWGKDDTPPNASDRKMRLYACSCCRRVWEDLDEDCHRLVTVAEGVADGLGEQEPMEAGRDLALDRHRVILSPLSAIDGRLLHMILGDSTGIGAMLELNDRSLREYGLDPQEARSTYAASWPYLAVAHAASQVWPIRYAHGPGLGTTQAVRFIAYVRAGVHPSQAHEVPNWGKSVSREGQASISLLRHIIGNPFRPYRAPPSWPSQVVQLAASIYEGQSCSFALHDALLEAGHSELAEHFQDEAWHPKGCWVLDLILGKK